MIRDTGPGIPLDIRTKVWDPFFSTKTGTNRGLGLSLVFKIVEQHQGLIDFTSIPGKGTEFTVKFKID